jgi:hypothetical protein
LAYSPAKGPGKGPGNGNAKKTFGKDVDPKAAQAKATGVRAKMREWRKAHPEWQGNPAAVSKKELRDYIASGIPDVIDKAFEVALDDKAPKQFEAIKMLTEQHLGRPAQAVEVSGKDGGGIVSEVRYTWAEKPEG